VKKECEMKYSGHKKESRNIGGEGAVTEDE
jgi:hypothetical protein